MTKHSSWIAFISIWGVSFHMVAAMGGVASGLAYVHTSTSDLSIVLNKAALFPFHHRLEYRSFCDLWVFLQQPHCKQSFVCLSFRFLKANVLHNSGLLGPALVASLARRPAPNLCTIYVLIREESDHKNNIDDWQQIQRKAQPSCPTVSLDPQPTSVTSVTQSALQVWESLAALLNPIVLRSIIQSSSPHETERQGIFWIFHPTLTVRQCWLWNLVRCHQNVIPNWRGWTTGAMGEESGGRGKQSFPIFFASFWVIVLSQPSLPTIFLQVSQIVSCACTGMRINRVQCTVHQVLQIPKAPCTLRRCGEPNQAKMQLFNIL